MNRSYLLYLSLLLLMVTVMLIVTYKLRNHERYEQLQSLTAENERLALWRIESQLLPLVIRESSRIYDDMLFNSNVPVELTADLIGCFRFDPADNAIPFEWKAASNNAPERLPMDDWSRQVRLDCGHEKMLAAMQTAFTASSLALGPSIPGGSDENLEPVYPFKGEPANNAYVNNSMQQAARSEQEFRSRSQYQSSNAALVNQLQSQAFPLTHRTRIEPMHAVWINQRLYLVRPCTSNVHGGIEGCVLNWDAIKPRLLSTVQDLLPDAELVPLREREADLHSLANLPLTLIPGVPDLRNLPIASALWPTLVTAWICFLASAVAIGMLLIGVVRLSERRAAFVSAVTHELRTPLTTLRLYADLLSQPGPLQPDKFVRYTDTLRRESNRLHYLIENVLAWSRLEQSAATYVIEPVNWQDLLDRLQPALQDRVAQSGCTYVYDPNGLGETVCFLGNPTAVERILFNLFDNACKYSQSAVDRRIHLRAYQSPHSLHLAVCDHGAGIDDDMSSRLFKPFSKSAEEAARTAPGIGLGLSLSRRLARDMRGDLFLVPSEEDGATFELRLPLAESISH